MVRRRTLLNSGAQARVRRADDHALRAACAEIVDAGKHTLAVGAADFDQLKTVLGGGAFGKAPLGLKPGLFRLLDDETDLDGGVSSARARRGEGRESRADEALACQHLSPPASSALRVAARPLRRLGYGLLRVNAFII